MVVVWQAALVSDESALEARACSRLCTIQIDELYLYLYHLKAVEHYMPMPCTLLLLPDAGERAPF